MTATSQRVPVLTMLHVLWRSFFFLAATNYERMQNVGFGYCMAPALRRLYQGEALKEAMARHLEFFNSHPYMAGALIGASIKLEEDVAAGRITPQQVSLFKRAMMGPMAAIGDNFFWSSLRPFAAAWAIAGVLSGIHWAPLAFLLLYNLFHLTLRVYGLFAGHKLGERVVGRIHQLELVRFAGRSHFVAGLFLGVAGAQIVERASLSPVQLGGGLEAALLTTLTVIAFLSVRRKISVTVLVYTYAGVCLALVLGLNALFPIIG